MKKTLLFLLVFLPFSLFAESQAVIQFRGLKNADSSVLIPDSNAQSIQDVDITPTGNGIKKRDGYALFKTIGVSTHPVRGGYYFRDVGGVDNIIHTNDVKIFKSVAGAAYSAFVTTDTTDSYYDFTDSQGYLWRANSSRDQMLRYDGTTVTYYPSMPKGDQVEALSDRLVISGTTANPNQINYSASANFTDFSAGILDTSAFTETVGLPGQKVNAIKVACGNNVMAWTRDSAFMLTTQSQNDINPTISISNTIGTLQPNSVIQDLGVTYWQGQDKHFYAYDCNTVQRISNDIDVSGFAGGESKAWTQTTQSDWDAGTKAFVISTATVGDLNLSTFTQTDTTTADFTAGSTSGSSVSGNSVYPSTTSDTDTTTADFTAGTVSNTSVINNRVYLSTNNTNVLNNSFETNDGTNASNWTIDSSAGKVSSLVAKSGTFSWALPGQLSTDPPSVNLLIKSASGTTLQTVTYPYSDFTVGAWVQKSVSLSSYVGRQIKLDFKSDSAGASSIEGVTSDTFLCSGSAVTFWVYRQENGSPFFSHFPLIDLVEGGRSTTYSGTFTSSAFDSTFTSGTWLASGSNWTTNSHSISVQTQSSSDGSSWQTAVSWSTGTAPASDSRRYLRYVLTLSTGNSTNGTALPYVDDVTLAVMPNPSLFTSQSFNTYFSSAAWLSSGANWTLNSYGISMKTQSSDDGSSWDSAVSWSTGSAPTSNFKKYIRYIATFSTGTSTDASPLPHLDDVTLSARASSGTFTSQTKNIGSNATSFGNFSADQTLNSGTIGYFIRTNTTEASLSTTTWTSLTRDVQITATINPWVQVKATFTITAATQDPSLQNFTVGWNEGSLARSFGSVDKDHRLMWSVGEGTATTASATYIYDPRFNSWLKYSFPMDAPARVGTSIYFGNPSSGNVYNWPSGTSDNGSAITAYWKSKDFIGTDPFTEKDFLTYSVLAKSQTGSNLDVIYTINTSSSITNNYSLTDANGNLFKRINANFPSGKFGTFLNIRFGNDDADAPFELYGFKFDFKPRPWRVMP